MTTAMLRYFQSEKRRKTLETSVFGEINQGDGASANAVCFPVMRLGLFFGDYAPRPWLMSLLKDHGLDGPDALKSKFNVPDTPLMLRPWPVESVVDDSALEDSLIEDPWTEDALIENSGLDDRGLHRRGVLDVTRAEPQAVFHQALCLGLCSTHRYDPNRPVIWTNGGLSRRVVCFSVGGFYQ